MEISELLAEGRAIWGDEKMTLPEISAAMGVVYGDICRWQRDAQQDRALHTSAALQKELGNIIFSTIRWCDDLGFAPEECIAFAIEAQKKYQEKNRSLHA